MPKDGDDQGQKRRLYEGSDVVRDLAGATETGWSVGDFWRWRYSDLMLDALKGDFAEWLVGKLLGLPMAHGGYVDGDNSDLRTSDGRTVEVKSSALWQSWKLTKDQIGHWLAKPPDETKVHFSRLFTRTASGAVLSPDAQFKSHVYIFAFQRERDPFKWDALDLSQWEFYALGRSVLLTEKTKRDEMNKGFAYKKFSLSLRRVRELHGPAMTAGDVRERAPNILKME